MKRRTVQQLNADAARGVQAYRQQRIPIRGILHADGEPGWGHLEMFEHPTEEVVFDIASDGMVVGASVEFLGEEMLSYPNRDIVEREVATGIITTPERAYELVLEIMRD